MSGAYCCVAKTLKSHGLLQLTASLMLGVDGTHVQLGANSDRCVDGWILVFDNDPHVSFIN